MVIMAVALPVWGGGTIDLEKRVTRYQLDNGLTVLIYERHISPTVSLYLAHRVGAVDEISGRTGTAHLLEHMMFKGTTTVGTTDYAAEKEILAAIDEVGERRDRELLKGSDANPSVVEELSKGLAELQEKAKTFVVENEIDRLYTKHGGADMNASTSQDMTIYHVSLPSSALELWARIESDRMQNPVFREFYSERDVVNEERRQVIESQPHRILLEQFLATAFIAHPYRRPVIGWSYDMEFLNKDYMESFFRDYYAPNNTVITVVGDVETHAVRDLIEHYFGSIPRQTLPLPIITGEPPQEGERRVTVRADAEPELMIGYHKPTLPSFDDYVFDVIDGILSDGRTSRLYRELVTERGIAQSINTANGLPGARYNNLFTFFVTPRSPHTSQECEEAVMSVLERLKRDGVTEEELEKVKNRVTAQFLRSMTSNGGLARTLTYFEVVAGDYNYIADHMSIIDSITADDVRETAKRYFTDSNKTVAELVTGDIS